MSKQFAVRQGDVLIVATDHIPTGAKVLPREDGRLVLAHGEVTGHAHVVDSPDALFLAADLDEMADRYLQVLDETTCQVPVFEMRPTGRTITPEPYYDDERGAMVYPDSYEELEQVQVGTDTVPGAQVVHDEHAPITLPPGNYRVVRQREYAPEQIRQVAD